MYSPRFPIFSLAVAIWAACLVPTFAAPVGKSLPPRSGTLSPYVDPAQSSGVPFGSHSHWAQPWRATLETVPAGAFLDGVGTVMGSGDPATVVPELAANGIRRLRYEEGWSNVDFDDPTRLDNAATFATFLRACKSAGVRPLILLNGNTGIPCPVRFFTATVASQVTAGAGAITLTDVSHVVPGRTGLTNVTGYAAGRPLFKSVSGHTVTLAQACPVALAAGQQITLSTLKYAPFTTANSADYAATLAGWRQYMQTVAVAARAALGTTGQADGGFDIEIWNELSFGSDFLNAANYGLRAGPDMTVALLLASATLAQSDPADFSGVGIGDGFANTIPWPASSWMPAAVTAIDKHPYHGRVNFPQDNPAGSTLSALSLADTYVPTYSCYFPEYYGTLIQTESLLRDSSPVLDESYPYSGIHGRYARGLAAPVPVWITEYRTDAEAGAAADEVEKSILRFYCFYLNKGVTQADYFNSDDLLGQPEAMTALGRICAVMGQGLDRDAAPRSLVLDWVSDTHGHVQFKGDGTTAHPDLLDRQCFAFLPYQANARRFVVPYYVMTRDVATDLADEAFTLQISGLGANVTAGSYDPLTGQTTPLSFTRSGSETTITVTATDCPRLLVFSDAG